MMGGAVRMTGSPVYSGAWPAAVGSPKPPTKGEDGYGVTYGAGDRVGRSEVVPGSSTPSGGDAGGCNHGADVAGHYDHHGLTFPHRVGVGGDCVGRHWWYRLYASWAG